MNRNSLLVLLVWTFSTTITFAHDYGFPTLNSVGRYLGVGWSHHTFHSRVDGRFDIISQRHPASAYPSNNLSYVYSPHYNNYPPRPLGSSDQIDFWHAPKTEAPTKAFSPPNTSILESVPAPKPNQSKNNAEELLPPPISDLTEPRDSADASSASPPPTDPPKPKEPPPNWLKPFLESEKTESVAPPIQLEPSPSDKTTSAPLIINRYRR